MPEPVIHQLSSFLLFMLGGLAIGFAYDFLRVLRTALHPKRLCSFLLDLTFWLVVLAIVFPLLLIGTWGEPRLFVWLALSLGITYYLLLLSGFLRSIIRRLIHLTLAGLGMAARIRRGARLASAEERWARDGRRPGGKARTKATVPRGRP